MSAADSPLVVITGCTRGLGRAMALEFARLGWTVAGCGRDADALGSLAAALGPRHRFACADVASAAEVETFAAEVLTHFGAPRLLLNNAAVINANAPLWQVPPDEFRAVLDIGVTGTFLVTRAFLPAMAAAARGVIVNFSSGWGRSTAPEVAPYCAAKWAIEGLTGALAAEVPHGLAAVSLNPGIIDTPMLRSCFGSHAAAYPSPDAWARTAVPFLSSLTVADNGRALTAP